MSAQMNEIEFRRLLGYVVAKENAPRWRGVSKRASKKPRAPRVHRPLIGVWVEKEASSFFIRPNGVKVWHKL